jgi:hypothetical protein
MILGRLMMRLLLVPLGGALAILVALLVAVVAHWNRFAAIAAERAATSDDVAAAIVIAGPWVALVIMVSTTAMMLPAALGALLAEAFAIRTWVYHVANGAISVWIGLNTLVEMRKPYDFYEDPLIAIGAGIAAGFAYWAVAGWSAGFWKPVFAQHPPVDDPPSTARA